MIAEARRFPNGEMYELALRLGLRRGELVGLRWTDVDFDAKTLTIRRTLQRLTGRGLVEMPTKTDSSDRRIPLSPVCINALRTHKRHQSADRDRAANAWTETGYVFTTRTGAPLDPQRLSGGIGVLCHRAGIRRIRFHDLRHTCATLLIEAGVSLVTVKELLGHSTITITANIYTHTRLPHQAGALGQLDTQLDPSPRPRRKPKTTTGSEAAPTDEPRDATDQEDDRK